MPRPKTKTELLTESRTQFNALRTLIAPLSEAVMTCQGACEDWSIKDILAHLHSWHSMYLRWYAEGMADKKPDMPAPGFTWATTPALNTQIYERYKEAALDVILENLDITHSKVMEIIESHSDAELFTKKLYGWTGSTSLGSYTVSAMCSHYDWAIKHIKKFLKSQQT